jgi:hypothetical protein
VVDWLVQLTEPSELITMCNAPVVEMTEMSEMSAAVPSNWYKSVPVAVEPVVNGQIVAAGLNGPLREVQDEGTGTSRLIGPRAAIQIRVTIVVDYGRAAAADRDRAA